MSAAVVDTVAVSGELQVTIRITGDVAGTPAVSVGDGAMTSIRDRVLRIIRDPDALVIDAVPIVEIEVNSLERVAAQSGAVLSVSGVLDQLRVEALDGATVDASALRLRSATLDLEKSEVSMCVAETVSGFVAYLSALRLTGGGDTSQVRVVNGGRIFTDDVR